jgi:hypothetical protein
MTKIHYHIRSHCVTTLKSTTNNFITVKTSNLIKGFAYLFLLSRTVQALKFESFFNFIVDRARYSFTSQEHAHNSRINNKCEGDACRCGPIIVPPVHSVRYHPSLWSPASTSVLLGAPTRFSDHYEPLEKTFISSNWPNPL